MIRTGRGAITRPEADAIVNAGNLSPLPSGEVDSLCVDKALRGHEGVLGIYHACEFFERLTVLEYKVGCD